MSIGHLLKLRCFLEGIEVPIVSAQVTIQPDAPAQCNIQIPATDRAFEFLPRTLVHVFFWDYYDGPSDTSLISAIEPRQVTTSDEEAMAKTSLMPEKLSLRPNPFSGDDMSMSSDGGSPNVGAVHQSDGEDSESINDRRWKLFYAGEVIGFQFQKSHNQRAVILQCLDLSVYWDTCYQYKVNASSLHGNATAHFVGAGTTLWDTFYQSSTSSIVDVVNRRSRSRPELTGLLSGVVHLLERVGGVYTNRGFRGVNDFFSIAELRLHLVDMITASEDDNSSQRVFPRRAFNRWTRREAGRLGKISSFREILNLLNGFIFHNTVPCPMAKFEPPETIERSRNRTSSRQIASTPAGQAVIVKLGLLHGLAISMRLAWNRRNFNADQVMIGEVSTAEAIARVARISRVATDAVSTLERLGVGKAASDVGTAKDKAQIIESGLRAGGWIARQSLLTSDFNTMVSKISSAIRELGGAVRTSSSNVTTEHQVGARLNSQIIRPDIFMCSPPKCNVLFPELYSSISFTRQYLREVSRMRLIVSDEIFGPDALLNNVYFAPDVEVLGERARQGRGATLEGATLERAAYTRRLMDHELLTGVVPVFERMNEVNIAAGRSNHVIHRGARVPFAARAANFQFFKHRLGPRTASMSGKFNPWIAPGFPCLVIDRWMTKEMVELSSLRGLDLLSEAEARGWYKLPQERQNQNISDKSYDPLDAWLALRETVPTQFVGLLMNVTHSVSQEEGSTSYSLTTARTHRERQEFLGANKIKVTRRDVGQVKRLSTVAALDSAPPIVGQLGPYYGTIEKVDKSPRRGSFHLYGTFGADRPRRQRVKVQTGVIQKANVYGPEVTAMVGDGDLEVTFRAYSIEENVDRWVGQDVEIPLEDFLRPPWMSDVWANDKIGAVYQQFFGTGAITDPITVNTGFVTSTESADTGLQGAEAMARQDTMQDPFRAEGKTIQEAEMAINVERAIDLLVRTYSAIKHVNADIDEFIRSYIYRPIADLVDILGSRDLKIDPNTGRRLGGTEGFHSRAFGRGQMGYNLRNIIPENQAGEIGEDEEEEEDTGRGRHASRLLGIGTGQGQDRRNLLSRLDKRSEKAERVLAYTQELWASRGLLG
ncbi:MAG: hypothetical protein ACXAEU_17170 [Candidatus Hodarchaeales archaeon]|jgi:hypothetical protein